jgi:hypothetical protein
MKIDAVIWREVRFVAVGTAFFSALLQLVYLAIGAWAPSVLLGTLLSAFASIANFLLLGVSVQKALALGDPDGAKASLKLSQMLRMFGMLAVLAVGVILDCFSTVAVIVSIFFPRMTLVVRQAVLAKRNRAAAAAKGKEEIQNEDQDNA